MKLERADNHLHTLENMIQGFIDSESREIVPDLDPESGYYIFRVKWHNSPPVECGVVLGDLLFNLRSALDQIVFALSAQAGPIPNERLPAFPIHVTPGDFKKNGLKRIRLVERNASAFIERVQPYHAANPAQHSLAVLDHLHERDKHRLLHVVSMALIRRHLIFKGIAAQRYWDASSVRWAIGPFINGAEVVRIRPRKPIPKPETYVDFDVASDVCFDNTAGPLPEPRVVRAIWHIRDYVRGVVARLEPFLI